MVQRPLRPQFCHAPNPVARRAGRRVVVRAGIRAGGGAGSGQGAAGRAAVAGRDRRVRRTAAWLPARGRRQRADDPRAGGGGVGRQRPHVRRRDADLHAGHRRHRRTGADQQDQPAGRHSTAMAAWTRHTVFVDKPGSAAHAAAATGRRDRARDRHSRPASSTATPNGDGSRRRQAARLRGRQARRQPGAPAVRTRLERRQLPLRHLHEQALPLAQRQDRPRTRSQPATASGA